ncbi:putative integrase [Methylobacterium sp. ME121]|nr:putative integrase [Methylobacterium sp. ME121]
MVAYSYDRQLKTLRDLTPHKFICQTWTKAQTIHMRSVTPRPGAKHLKPSAALDEAI